MCMTRAHTYNMYEHITFTHNTHTISQNLDITNDTVCGRVRSDNYVMTFCVVTGGQRTYGFLTVGDGGCDERGSVGVVE